MAILRILERRKKHHSKLRKNRKGRYFSKICFQDLFLRFRSQRLRETPHALRTCLTFSLPPLTSSPLFLDFIDGQLLCLLFSGYFLPHPPSLSLKCPSSRHHPLLFSVWSPVPLITAYRGLCSKVRTPQLDIEKLP